MYKLHTNYVQGGKMKPKTERNEEMYKDWKAGMLGVDMVAKYRVSSANIYKIVARMKQKELTIDNHTK